jgi:hypothetical protein
MENEYVNADGTLKIVPSETSSVRDYDFYFGKWKIHNRKLKARLASCDEWVEFDAEQECRPLLLGAANIDNFLAEVNGNPFEGMTLRLFDPKTRLWSIYWADSNVVAMDVPQIGSWDGPTGRFFARDTYNGKDIIVQFLWDKTDPESPTWSQSFSEDDGETWEWNWYMYMSRAA